MKRKPANRRAGEVERAHARELAWRYRDQVPCVIETVDGCELELHVTAEDLCNALEKFARFGTFRPTLREEFPRLAGRPHLPHWYRWLREGGLSQEDALAWLADRNSVSVETVRHAVFRRRRGGGSV